jgi:hypothetical protein
MQPTEQKIQTSAGMETATETVDRIKGQLGSTSIPVSAIESNAPAPLAMPEIQLPQADIGGVRSAGQQIIDRETQRAQAELAKAEAPVTESERQIRNAFGILSTESETRGELEKRAGVNQYSQDLQKFQQNLRRQMAELDQFDLDNVNTIEQMRVDASRRDITKRTFGAQSAEAGIQMAVQRAGMVASTRATIAGIEATQGNLQQAVQQVDKALEAIYAPVRMQMQMDMFFLERNDKRFDAAQKEAANARMMGIQQQMKDIDRATELTDMAVASGFASPDDISTMVGMSGNPVAQAEFAQQIVAKAQRQNRIMQQQQQAAQMNSIYLGNRAKLLELAMNGDPQSIQQLGYDPRILNGGMATLEDIQNFEATKLSTNKTLETIDRALSQSLGIKASTGAAQSVLGTSFAASTPFGQPLPGAKNLARMIPGVGLGVSYAETANQKMNLLSDVSFLTNDATFRKMIQLKQSGVTFGALTEGERKAIGAAADNLFSMLTVNDDGSIKEIRASEKRFTDAMAAYREEVLFFQENQAEIMAQMNAADRALIDSF